MAVPPIILVLVVLGVFSSSPSAAMVALGVLASPAGAGRPRGHARGPGGAVRRPPPRSPASATPASWRRHILRRVLGPILVQDVCSPAVALCVQAALAFLGLLSCRQSDLGRDDRRRLDGHHRDTWLLVPPGVILASPSWPSGFSATPSATSPPARPPTRRGPPAAPAEQRRPDPTHGCVQGSRGARSAHTSSRRGNPPGETAALLEVRRLASPLQGRSRPRWSDDVTFASAPARTVGVVGESGCGKSVTALAVLGLLPAGVTRHAGQVDLRRHRPTPAAAEPTARPRRGHRVRRPGRARQPRPDPHRRQPAEGGHRRHDSTSRRERRTRAMELLDRSKMPGSRASARSLPARDVRRHGPARQHRHRPGRPSRSC